MSDLVLSPHGAAMTNILFMRPYTVIVEVAPPYFMELLFCNLAHHARVRHILVHNFYRALVDGMDDDEITKHYWDDTYMSIRPKFKSTKLRVDFFQILSAVEDGVNYLQMRGCRYSPNNDIESVLF